MKGGSYENSIEQVSFLIILIQFSMSACSG